jgi:hypothetical protein
LKYSPIFQIPEAEWGGESTIFDHNIIRPKLVATQKFRPLTCPEHTQKFSVGGGGVESNFSVQLWSNLQTETLFLDFDQAEQFLFSVGPAP